MTPAKWHGGTSIFKRINVVRFGRAATFRTTAHLDLDILPQPGARPLRANNSAIGPAFQLGRHRSARTAANLAADSHFRQVTRKSYLSAIGGNDLYQALTYCGACLFRKSVPTFRDHALAWHISSNAALTHYRRSYYSVKPNAARVELGRTRAGLCRV